MAVWPELTVVSAMLTPGPVTASWKKMPFCAAFCVKVPPVMLTGPATVLRNCSAAFVAPVAVADTPLSVKTSAGLRRRDLKRCRT